MLEQVHFLLGCQGIGYRDADYYAMAVYATLAGFFITYVPGTTITAVNAAFNAAFPNGLPSGTPLTGKCK